MSSYLTQIRMIMGSCYYTGTISKWPFQRTFFFLTNNVHEKITRFWLAEHECIHMQHECKVVTRVKSCNTSTRLQHVYKLQIKRAQTRARFQNFVSLDDFLWCFSFFHVNYQLVTTWFLVQFGVINTCKFSKTTNCTCPTGSCNFVVFENLPVRMTPNLREIMLLPLLTVSYAS